MSRLWSGGIRAGNYPLSTDFSSPKAASLASEAIGWPKFAVPMIACMRAFVRLMPAESWERLTVMTLKNRLL